ncbi:MAG: DUF1636 family protein [Cohaesibacteraceae bacterium]
MANINQVCLSVCTRCKPPSFAGADTERPGYQLAGTILQHAREATDATFSLTIRGVRCMSQCKRACVVALSAPAKFTLVFGDLDVETDADAVVALAHQFAHSPDGLVPRSERPAPLRAGILGRIPPLGYAGEALDERFAFHSNAHPTKELL